MKEGQPDNKTSKIRAAISVGAAGGFFWSSVGYIIHYMNFTSIGPSILIAPFITPTFSHKPLAHLLGIAAATILGILFALVYVYTLSKFYNPGFGLACGLALFVVFYYGWVPLFGLTKKTIHQMGASDFTSQLCLFLLFGLFVGFSLSSEFSSKEPGEKTK